MEDKFLCFINYVGKEIDDFYIYNFFFTTEEKLEGFWGEGFNERPACIMHDLLPDNDGYDDVVTVKLPFALKLATESNSFSFQDAMDKIIALCYRPLDDLEEYPENGRMVLHYGDTYDKVEYVLGMNKVFIADF
jgi:hypothetical protein